MELNEIQLLETVLSPQLIKNLHSFSTKTNISISELLEISISSLLEKMNNTTEPNVALNNKEMILRNKVIISQNKEVLNK